MYLGTPLTSRRHKTLCRVGGQLCALSISDGTVQADGTMLMPTPEGGVIRVPAPGDRVLVDDGSAEVVWLSDQPGASQEQAAALGLAPQSGPGNASLRADQVEGPFVNFHDLKGELWPTFPGPAMYGELVEPTVKPDAEAGLRASLAESMAEDWQQVRLACQALGNRLEVAASVLRAGAECAWIPPEDVVEWLRRLRVLSYTRESGAWTSAKVVFVRGGEITAETGHDEPVWQYEDRDPTPKGVTPEERDRILADRDDGYLREYYDELKHFPRDRAAMPDWLLHKAWQYHARLTERERTRETRSFDQYVYGVRAAETFDGRGADDRPTVYRPALTRAEKEQVLEYLRNGHLVVSAYSRSEDLLEPQRPAEVPNIWLTDGPWVWPAAMTYYLHEHNISPPNGFLDHIRAESYRAPAILPDAASERAKNALMGGDEFAALPYQAETHRVIDVVRRMLAGLRLTKRSYSFDAVVEGAWCMLQERDGWWSVFLQTDGKRKEEVRFHQTMDAAAHLVGCLSMTHELNRRPPDEVLEDYECLFQPMAGDPPLSDYEGKLHVELQAGYEVDRIGDLEGNTVFVAGTALPHRGMTPDQQPVPYHRYRVKAPFEVVVGYLRPKPEHGVPGGGQAYVLPQSVRSLVEGNWLVELA